MWWITLYCCLSLDILVCWFNKSYLQNSLYNLKCKTQFYIVGTAIHGKACCRQSLEVQKTLSIYQISMINWCCVCIAPWNWAQSGKELIVTFMVHAMCIQCRVWTLPWSLMHSVVTPKRSGQRLCRGRVPMSYWLKKKKKIKKKNQGFAADIWILSSFSFYLFCKWPD